MKTLIIATIMMMGTSIYAAFDAPPPGYSGGKGSNNRVKYSLKYPADNSPELRGVPDKIKQNKFELNIDKDEVYDVQMKKDRFNRLMDGTYEVNIMKEISYRPLRSIDQIFLLNKYTTTLKFPEKYKINDAIPSVKLESNSFSKNLLFLKPTMDFREGNIIVSLTDGRKNLVVQILMKKFIKGISEKNDTFHSFITYVDVPKIKPFKLLEIYFKLYGKNRISFFNKDGKFDIIEYKKIPFYIIRDDKFGNIEYRNVNFRITNKI